MPFAIREQGERSKTLAHIQSLKEKGQDGNDAKDQSQIDIAKSAISAEVNALPEKLKGVLVIASGSAAENQRNLNIQVIGLEGHY